MKAASNPVSFRRRLVTAGVLAASAVQAGGAIAQESGGAGRVALEEVVVTAQKRSQSIMDVPISMTAFGTEEMEARRIQKVEDLLLVSPGVQYVETGDFLKSLSIRGINDTGGGLFQTTSVTIDDATLVATYNGFLLTSRLFDVERVEVLRGPQGTLTGSNSTSGTVNIITHKPDMNEFSGEATLDYSRYDTTLLRGIVNVPVTDTLALRAVGYKEDSDGAVENKGPAGGGSTRDHYGVRVAARWQPTERFTLDLALSKEEQEYGASNALTVDADYANPANDGRWWAETYRRNIAALEAAGGRYGDSDFMREVGNDGGNIYSNEDQTTEHDITYGSVHASYELDRYSLDAYYTHYDHDLYTLTDLDQSEFAFVRNSWDGGPESDYAELRVSSDYEGSLNWVAGASYMKERRVLDQRYDITDAFLAAYFGVGDIADTDPVNGPWFVDYWEHTLEQIETSGVFANVFWDISDRLHLSVGGRVSFIETTTQSQYDVTGNFGSFDDTLVADSTEFDPRVALNFDLNEELTTYVQYATGYRSGYGNTGPGVDLGIAPEEVDPEKLKNYELGIKGRLLDNSLTLAAAVFYMDYSDMQVGVTVPIDDGSAIGEVDFDTNANSAEASGFEAEVSWSAAPGLFLSASGSYVDSSIDEYENDGVIYRDVAFPRVGHWTADATAQYTHGLSAGSDLVFRADYSYRDGYVDYFPWLDVGEMGTVPSYEVVNMSLGLQRERWSATLYMDNVFDEVYWQGTNLGYSTRGSVTPFVARTYGVRLTARM